MVISSISFRTSLVILLAALLGTFLIAQRGEPRVIQTNIEKIPKTIGAYLGQEDSFPDGVYEELNADQHLYRHYRAPDGNRIDLYIGYYGTAKGGRTGHNPYACLPGAGWGIVENGFVELKPSYYPQGVKVKYVVASRDGLNNVMLHWYQAAGTKILATGVQQNIQRLIGRILHNRNDGAYVQVNGMAAQGDIPIVKQHAIEFAHHVLELLPDYWPLEQ